MAITDRTKDMAFKRVIRSKPIKLEDVEQVELKREDHELTIIQARLHYENAYHALTRTIVSTDSADYHAARDIFLKASDAFYKLQYDRVNTVKR